MTVTNAWHCRTTTDLSHDFSVLTGTAVLLEDEFLPNTSFPGVLLFVEQRLHAVLGYRFESDGTIAITDPVFTTAVAEDLRSAWFQSMLDHVAREARKTQCRSIRAVQPGSQTETRNWMRDVLQTAGFSVQARVIRWITPDIECRLKSQSQFASVLSPSNGEEIMHTVAIEAKTLVEDSPRFQCIRKLLGSILVDSQDLPNLPTATSEELINEWTNLEATIFVAETPRRSIGLCVTLKQPGIEENRQSVYAIQYIGVEPAYRREGIASLMLTTLREQVCLAGSEDGVMLLAAFADQQNEPATRLYQKNGFRPDKIFDIWSRNSIES